MVVPVEICLARSLGWNKMRNFASFFKEFKAASCGLVLYQGEVNEETVGGKPLYLVPWWLWW